MWRELISQLFEDAKFSDPATPLDVEQVERTFKLSLPDELRDLLFEANGVAAHYSAPLIWSAAEIIEQNLAFRDNGAFAELYMPFDCLLFFGAEGNGDQFAYRVLAGQIPSTSFIYEWDHESDDRVWFATDLKDYFRRCAPSDA